VRPHLAKQVRGCPHPAHPERGVVDSMREPHGRAGPWRRFLAVRAAIDPAGGFLHPLLRASIKGAANSPLTE